MNSWWTSSKSNTWSHPVCFFPGAYGTDWTRQDCQMTCSPSGPTDHSATSLLLLCYTTSLLQRLLPWDARVGTCIPWSEHHLLDEDVITRSCLIKTHIVCGISAPDFPHEEDYALSEGATLDYWRMGRPGHTRLCRPKSMFLSLVRKEGKRSCIMDQYKEGRKWTKTQTFVIL